MDPYIVQNLRHKLQKRIDRLNSVEGILFMPALKQFWAFFDAHPTYLGIAELLTLRFPDLSETVDRIFSQQGLLGNTEEESAAIGYAVLRRLVEENAHNRMFSLGSLFGSGGNLSEAADTIRKVFLEPFYEYVDEQLDDQRAMLTLLLRYKRRSEWFHGDRLWKMAELETRRAEKALMLDVYSYLYDQGIDFTIEPSSITGEIDLIADQNSDDPLLLDGKIFDGDHHGKTYILRGFNQIYTYTQQYNEPFGYLLIFKRTDRDLCFSLSTASRGIPTVVFNHKTIFLITVDIYPHSEPTSRRKPPTVVKITEEDLTRIVGESGPESSITAESQTQ